MFVVCCLKYFVLLIKIEGCDVWNSNVIFMVFLCIVKYVW